MMIDIYPSVVSGSIAPPPSKSVLHRAIISACMAKGVSTITNVIYSDDVTATINAFRSLGVTITTSDKQLIIDSSACRIGASEIVVDCNESGSTIRFLIPLLSNVNYTLFKGNSSLINRPMDVYCELFTNQDLVFEKGPDYIRTKGALRPGNYNIRGDISSQFISGLLFVLPTLDGESTIVVQGNFESSEYVDLTVDVLKAFGIDITRNGNVFSISGNQSYKCTDYIVESDYSQMAFFAVLGIVNNSLSINNMNTKSKQPDRRILEVIKAMKGVISNVGDLIVITKSKTSGTIVDVSQCPDIAPIIGLLGACSSGVTKIINAKRLILKESNRLLSTYQTLVGFGVDAIMEKEGLVINGGNQLQANVFDSYNDHRIAMMIAIGATVSNGKVTINNAEAINKSYPHFYKDLQSLGAVIKYK